MGHDTTGRSFFQGALGKVLRRKSAEERPPDNTVLAMLERLHNGEHPDYCLYLRPQVGAAVNRNMPLAVDLEDLLLKAIAPLTVVTLDESVRGPGTFGLPDEAFLTLSNRARILCVVPTADERCVQRLRLIKTKGPLARCIFVMPEQGTLGTLDWPSVWPAACDAAAGIGLELSGYTAGGWLFRLDNQGKSCTFRPIVNPNPEKIAKAMESICGDME